MDPRLNRRIAVIFQRLRQVELRTQVVGLASKVVGSKVSEDFSNLRFFSTKPSSEGGCGEAEIKRRGQLGPEMAGCCETESCEQLML